MVKTDFEEYLATIPCEICNKVPRIFMDKIKFPDSLGEFGLYYIQCCRYRTHSYVAGNVWNMLEEWEQLMDSVPMHRKLIKI